VGDLNHKIKPYRWKEASARSWDATAVSASWSGSAASGRPACRSRTPAEEGVEKLGWSGRLIGRAVKGEEETRSVMRGRGSTRARTWTAARMMAKSGAESRAWGPVAGCCCWGIFDRRRWGRKRFLPRFLRLVSFDRWELGRNRKTLQQSDAWDIREKSDAWEKFSIINI
jgi:hypothetical protein